MSKRFSELSLIEAKHGKIGLLACSTAAGGKIGKGGGGRGAQQVQWRSPGTFTRGFQRVNLYYRTPLFSVMAMI
jgi:hypothetical protein